MALSATLHCLTGCAIGEIAGLMIGTGLGLGNGWTIAVSIALAFLFGFTLSTLPLVKGGLAVGTALSLVLAADTLSIATMEIVDNLVMLVIPGAMEAGMDNPLFWASMTFALGVAYLVAYPVNRLLLKRGRGHAIVQEYHHGGEAGEAKGWRRRIPQVSSATLAAVILAFMLGGFTAAVGAQLSGGTSEGGHGAVGALIERDRTS